MAESIFSMILNTPYREEIALSEGDKRVTFDEFKSLIKKTARNLRSLGINKGDVVTVALPNIMESVIAFYGVNAVGGIANMVHPSLPQSVLTSIQEDTHSILLIGMKNHKSINKKITCRTQLDSEFSWEKFISLDAPEILYNEMDSVSVYLHSGGTTDNPKTIVLSSENFNSLAKGLGSMFKKDEARGYRSLTTLPLFHGFGLGAGVHAMLNLGVELVMIPKFDKFKTPDIVVDKKINMILGVPLIFQAILASGKVRSEKDLSYIKNCFIGGDSAPVELTANFNNLLRAKNSPALLCEGYGLTECVSVCTVNRNDNYKEGSIGLPLDNVEVAIMDDNDKILSDESIGEICVSGGIVMQRYLSGQNNCFTEKNGKKYLKTGDYGYRDVDGYYYFVERKKRIVKISGVTVFPSEVENVLRTHFAVSNAFVKPASQENSKLKAFVVLKKDRFITEDQLKEYCRNHLMKWAVPEEFVFLNELPLTPIGKIDKKNPVFN